jgi:hypothetical protein
MKHTNTIALFFFILFAVFNSQAQIVINEVQTSNTKTIADEFSSWDDWIEIYNAGPAAVNLAGYGLSDDSLKPYRFIFPSYSLAPGAFITVFASDSNQTVLTHWETAVKASDTWKYRANTSNPGAINWTSPSFNDAAWSSGTGGIGMSDSDDGTTIAGCASVYMRRTFSISDTSKIFGAVFNMDYDDGFVAYLNGVEIARINVGSPGIAPAWNEIAPASHEAVLYQNQYPDSFYLDLNKVRSLLVNGNNLLAVETHNQSGTFTDMTSNPFLTFAIANGSSFYPAPPSWFHKATTTYFHAKFKVSKSGETIFLTDPSGILADKKATGNMEVDNSIGRNPDGSSNWCLTDHPTPGTTNNVNACQSGYATIPIFSLFGGFYTGTKTLTLSTTFPNGAIRYTTDGSDVTDASTLYTAPIQISATKTIRARVYATGAVPSPTITHTYFINFTCRLPVFSLTTDPKNLYDYNTGIFVDGPGAQTAMPHFGANYWLDMDKDVTLEYYERDKSLQFQFNAGMAITGGWSRTAPQKNLEIKLGDKYGLSSLNYSMETLKPWNDKWDDFILHATGNDRDICHMRDPLMNRVLKPTNCDYIAYEPCLVVLNGQNWGIYYVRENDDHHWVETNYGYKSSEIDFLKESYFYPGIEVKKGSDSAYFAMYNYATTTSPSDPAFYSTISSMMDLENMADYFIAETYYPNDDWMGGGNNNLKLWRPKKADGKFRYLIYDLDFGLGYSGTVTNNMLGTARNPSPHNYNSDLFNAFTANSTYKRYFINRYADLINTIFLPANIQSQAYLLRDSLKYDYRLQNQKWGGADSTAWINNIANMITFATNRPAYARNFVQSEFGMTGQVTLTLQVSPAGAGTIQISTINPATYPWNGVYFNGNPVTITAIPNPGYTFDHWRSNVVINSNNTNQSVTYNFTSNDVITCYFTGSAASVDLAFSELNYHSDSIADAGDWIEIHNRGNYTIDLSNWKFRDEGDNHTFTFPVSTVIPANGYLVLASDRTKFNAVHPTVTNVIGSFNFDFSNGGETLRLFNSTNQLYTSFTYSDQLPFTAQADGQGYTLERLNETASGDDGNNWFAGCLHGSPGRAYTPPVAAIATPASSVICAGGSTTLNATSVNGAVYQWYKNNTAINGATTNQYTANETGYYKLLVTANGCAAYSDSILLTVQNNEQVLSTVGSARCGNGTLTLTASGTSTLNWFADSVSTNVLFAGSNFVTPSISQNTNYFVQASGSCPSARVSVTATVNPVTAAPQVTNAARCGDGGLQLSASDTSSVIRWFDASSGGTLVNSGSSFNTPVLNQTTTYYVEAGSLCPSQRIAAIATINAITATPIVTSAGRCGDGQLTLLAQDTAIVNWFDAATNGNLIATGTSYTTPVLTTTTTYYVEAGTLCPSARVAVVATIENISAAPIVTDAARCGTGNVTLTANTPTASWFDSDNGGNLIYVGNSFTTALNSTTTYFVQDGSVCPSPRVAATATINPIPADPIVSGAENCGAGQLTLSATDTSSVNWYSNAIGGNVIASGDHFTTPLLTSSTTYYVEAADICLSNRVAVTAVIKTITPDPIVTDVYRCGTGDITLHASSAEPLNWFDLPNGNTVGSGADFLISNLSGSATYYVQAGSDCPSAFVAVNAEAMAITADPIVTDGQRCGAGSVVLNASSSATINWYLVPNGNILNSGSTYTTPSIAADEQYYVQATDGFCPSQFVAVHAVINPLPDDAQVIGAAVCGSGSMTLLANAADAIHWYDAPNGNLLSIGNSFVTANLNATEIYFVQTVNANCTSGFVPVEATVNPLSEITSFNNGSICGQGVIDLQANSTDPIEWFDAIGGNLLFTGTNFTTPLLTASTTYYVIANGICPSAPIAINANVYANPVIDLGTDTAITSGDVLVLDAGNGFVNYAWNTFEITQDISVTTAGTYSVIVTDANGCSATDTIDVSVIAGLASVHNQVSLSIYPNPFVEKCIVTLPPSASAQQINVYDANGRLLYAKEVNKNSLTEELDFSQYAAGSYFISVINETGGSISKCIKK